MEDGEMARCRAGGSLSRSGAIERLWLWMGLMVDG